MSTNKDDYNLKFLCIKSFFMETYEDENGEVAFVKGKTYVARTVGDAYAFIDEHGDHHYMEKEDTDDDYILADYLILQE